MNTSDDLQQQQCLPCQGGVTAFEQEAAQAYLAQLHEAWQLDAQLITRRLKFKNFAKTMFFVNALAHLADQEGHHPDVKFGYNYCEVSFSTHEAGGLTINDFICAKKVDALLK